MKRFDGGGDLLLTIEDGGFWIRFSASDGTETEFDILTLASTMDPMTGHTLLQWCRDRMREPRSISLIADALEGVETRMDEIAAKLATKGQS